MRQAMTGPTPNPGILDIPDYFQGGSSIEGVAEPVKLSSNENMYGPSPYAVAAIRAAAEKAHIYPEGQATVLNQALGARFAIPAERIVTSTGSDDLIPMLIRAFAAPGDEVMYFTDSFPKYTNYVLGAGCRPVVLPRDKDQGYEVQVENVASALTPRTKALILDNPCNPTGAVLDADRLSALHAALPSDVILLLDEAYVEFSDLGDAGLRMAASASNIATFRTFSKAYGLAGLRIGWCTGSEVLVSALRRLRASFPVTVPSIDAAVAALGDQAHTEQAISAIRATRARVSTRLRAAGWDVPESHGNFVLLRGGPMERDAANDRLLAAGILARPLTIQGGEPVLRMTVGTDAQMDLVLSALGA